MPIQVDLSQRPLIRITWVGQPSISELDKYFEDIEEMYAAKQSVAVLYDVREACVPTASVSMRLVSGLRSNLSISGKLVRGAAIIVDSPLIARAVDSIRWGYHAPFSIRVYDSPDDAEPWLLRIFHETDESLHL